MSSTAASSTAPITRPSSVNPVLPNRVFPKFVNFTRESTRIRRFPSVCCVGAREGDGGGDPQRLVRDSDGLIIVDHGSRRRESNLMLNDFVDMFRGRTGYTIVEPAHMELAEPTIKDAFRLCVQQGAKRVIISPFFLFPGRHWQEDIPALAADAAKDHHGVSYLVTAPLGLHDLLVDVMNDRINHCLSHAAGEANECDVCAGSGKCRFY